MSVEVLSLYVLVLIIVSFAMSVKIISALTRGGDARKLHKKRHKSQPASTELAIPEDPPKVYESYGHPAPPVALLGASLCRAPIGYGWEITAAINEDGNPALRLAMLDLKSSTVIDAIERDMVIVRRWQWAEDDTYAAFYRRAHAIEQEKCDKEYRSKLERYSHSIYLNEYPRQSMSDGKLAGKVMMANLITPMVDWAALLTLRFIVENPDDTKCNYMLIESMEGAKV